MKPIMFKFNNDRQEQYRTQTVIYDSMTGYTVWKSGLTLDAQKHIEQMCKNQQILQEIYPECNFCTATIEHGGVRFDFLEGESYSDRYEKAIRKEDKELFAYLLKKQAEIILSCVNSNKSIFRETKQYTEVFGDGSAFKGQTAQNVANFEFTSHNMILNAQYGLCGVIDYEYVFHFPVPIDLLLYHCVVKTNLWTIERFSEMMTVQEMLDLLNISTSIENLESAWNMFDKHYGRSAMAEAKLRYLKGKDDIAELKSKAGEMQQEIIGNKNYINILTENLGKQQKYIENLTNSIKEEEHKYFESQQNNVKQKAEIQHLRAAEKMAVYKLEKLEDRNNSLIEMLECQETEAEKTKQELLVQISETRRELESIRNSVCWKITAPIRFVGNKVKRV